MTVLSDPEDQISDGDGVTVAFPYAGRNADISDIKCIIYGVDGAPRTPTYTVTGDEAGVTVTITSEVPPVGDKVLRYRDTALRQSVNYEAGNFPSSTHEANADKLIMAAQERKEVESRSLRMARGSGDIPEIEEFSSAGRALISKEGGGFTEGPSASDITSAQGYAERAKAWSEGDASPDGDPVSKSSKTWAGEAKASADRVDLGALDAAVYATGADAAQTALDVLSTSVNATRVENAVASLNSNMYDDAVADILSVGDTSWWDPSDISTLWQDAARTVPVTATGQTVLAIDDKGSAGLHLTNLTGTAGTYEVDARGYGYIDHSGGDGALYATGVNFAQPFTMIGAAVPSVGAGYVMTAGTGATRKFAINVKTSGAAAVTTELRNSTGNYAVSGLKSSARVGVPVVASAAIRDGSGFAAINDQDEDAAAVVAGASDTGMTGWRVGYNGVGFFPDGLSGFYGGMLIRNALYSEQTVRKLRVALMRKCGLVDTQQQRFDALLGAGQSNLGGSSGQPEVYGSPVPTFGTAAEFLPGPDDYTGGTIAALADPIRASNRNGLGRAYDCSVWPSFCESYYTATGRRPLVINGACGSQGLIFGTVTPWADDILLNDLVLRYKTAKARIEASGGIIDRVNVVWLGGEADAISGETKADWKAAFALFLTRMRDACDAPDLKIGIISIDRTTDPSQDAAYAVIREAQSESADEVDGIEMISPYQDYVTDGYVVDNVHWNNVALNDAGARAGANMAALTLPKLIP